MSPRSCCLSLRSVRPQCVLALFVLVQKAVQRDIERLRVQKAESMTALIGGVYGGSSSTECRLLSEMKLDQVALHRVDGALEDRKTALKLERESMEIECEELQNELFLLEKRRELSSAKRSQIESALKMDGDAAAAAMAAATTKEIAVEALSELKRLQNVERAQRRCLEATEAEMARMDGARSSMLSRPRTERKRQSERERARTQRGAESEAECESVESVRRRLAAARSEREDAESERDAVVWALSESERAAEWLQHGAAECIEAKSESLRMAHHFENSIRSKRWRSESASRRNSEALELLMAISFEQKEYGMKLDRINNEYRDTQRSLKRQFMADFRHKTSRNILNRRMLIEQHSDRIIQRRNDRALCGRPKAEDSKIQSASTATMRTKAVTVTLGRNTIRSQPIGLGVGRDRSPFGRDHDDEDALSLKPIEFVWSEIDDEDDGDRHDLDNDDGHDLDDDDEDALSSDFNLDHDDGVDVNSGDEAVDDGTFKTAVQEVRQWADCGQIDIEQVLGRQLQTDSVDDAERHKEEEDELGDIAMHSLSFDPVHVVRELLSNWNAVHCSNTVH